MSHPLQELQALYEWVDSVPLSRPKKNIARDFADGGERGGSAGSRPASRWLAVPSTLVHLARLFPPLWLIETIPTSTSSDSCSTHDPCPVCALSHPPSCTQC